MVDNRYVSVDGVNWRVPFHINNYGQVVPHCPTDHMELVYRSDYTTELVCDDCGKKYSMPDGRNIIDEAKFVWRKVEAEAFKNAELIKLDDVYIPVAKENIKSSEDSKYGVQARLVQTRSGNTQLVIYVGEKGRKNAQIFLDIDNKKLSFDHKDGHPFGIFAKVEATFEDGSKSIIEKGGSNE